MELTQPQLPKLPESYHIIVSIIIGLKLLRIVAEKYLLARENDGHESIYSIKRQRELLLLYKIKYAPQNSWPLPTRYRGLEKWA